MAGRALGPGGARRRCASLALALLVATLAVPPAARADLPFDFSLTGWWRGRYFLAQGLPVDRNSSQTQTEFFDYRLTVEPTLSFSESLVLKGRLNFLGDVILGRNDADATLLSGLSRGSSEFTRTDELEPVDDLQVERLWMELPTPLGQIRVGRQPSHWGLGILSNSGGNVKWGLEGNGPVGGDTVDRILFVTDLARAMEWRESEHWMLSLIADRAVENQVAVDTDDVNQFVLATMSTNGSLAPRRIGARELGTYVVLLNATKRNGLAVILDVYGHVEAGPLFFEGEAVYGAGKTQRAGLIPGDKKAEAEESMIESVAEDLIETTSGALSMADAIRYATYGFPAFLQGFVSSSLFDAGFSREVSLTIAENGVPAGFDLVMEDTIEVEIYGGVARAGWREGMWTIGVEGGWSSGPDGEDDFALARVGPEGSGIADVNERIDEDIDDLSGKGALLGTEFLQFPFDSEFDPALILYDQAGPINPATGLPSVTNTRYAKLYVQVEPTEKLTAYVLGIWGQLNTPLTLVFDRTDPSIVKFVLDEDEPGEYEVRERDLGIEVDLGAAYRFHENLKAEVKLGVLFTGPAFRPHAEDIFSVRPQIAILF